MYQHIFCYYLHGIVVNALVVISEVALRRARLLLGWVTVCKQVNRLRM